MIVLRSESEIASIRKAGAITAEALSILKAAARPGISTAELESIAANAITARKGIPAFKGYRGYPAHICTSVNDVVVHGIPSDRRLRSGDIVSLDIGVKCDGYFADAAITVAIGKVSAEADRLMAVTRDALHRGLQAIVPGARLSNVSHAIQEHVEQNGFSVVRVFVGHGIGAKLHEDPEIPNFGKCGTGPRLEKGMVLAIEPMVNAGSHDVEILDDGWTAVTADGRLSAHFEHTVAVTGSGFEILTPWTE